MDQLIDYNKQQLGIFDKTHDSLSLCVCVLTLMLLNNTEIIQILHTKEDK